MKKVICVAFLIAALGCDINNTDKNTDGIIFEKIHGLPNSAEWVTSMSPLIDGGFIITGSTDGIGFGQQNTLLMKVDREGNYLWQKSFGVEGENESAFKVIETGDRGYLFIGYTNAKGAGNSDMYLVKTDQEGLQVWDKTYGSPTGEYGYDILPVKNGYLLLGNTNNTNSGYSDFFVVRIDLDGNQLWSKNFGTDNIDKAHRLIALNDGSIILGGYSWGNADYIDIYLVKISADGDFIWDKRFDGPQELGASGDFIGNMKPTPDGGFIIAGTKLNADDETDYYIVRMDLSGTVLWEKVINQSTSDQGVDIHEKDDVVTIVGRGYELEKWYQVYLMSFRGEL